jgi:hypothetical protein
MHFCYDNLGLGSVNMGFVALGFLFCTEVRPETERRRRRSRQAMSERASGELEKRAAPALPLRPAMDPSGPHPQPASSSPPRGTFVLSFWGHLFWSGSAYGGVFLGLDSPIGESGGRFPACCFCGGRFGLFGLVAIQAFRARPVIVFYLTRIYSVRSRILGHGIIMVAMLSRVQCTRV